MRTVYLNGEYLPYDDARIRIDDRGFMLADGIYEAIRVYDGQPFALNRHLARLQRSATALHLTLDPGVEELERVCWDLLKRNGMAEASIYLQVTRGAAPRVHWMPADLRPTTLVIVNPASPPPAELVSEGASAITVPDDRWARCDVKAIGLTANVLAKQQAREANAFEAIFVRDGTITDCSSCNVFAVFNGVVQTAPKSNYILAGITRDVVLELAHEVAIPTREEPFRVEQLRRAQEVFLTSTTTEVLSVVRLDGAPIGDGRPGPLTGCLRDMFLLRTGRAVARI